MQSMFSVSRHSSIFSKFFRRLRVLTASVKNVEFCFKLVYKLISSLSVKYSPCCTDVDILLKMNVLFSLVLSLTNGVPGGGINICV